MSPMLSAPHVSQGVYPVLDIHSLAESGNIIYFKVLFKKFLSYLN